MRSSFRAVGQRPSQRRRPFASISLIQSRATLQHCEVRAHGLPALIRASHYPAIDVQAFPRAVLATGETTDSFCGCANPWRHRDADTRRCADGARSRSRQLGVRPPPKPFWRAPADCFWLSASRAPPAGLIRGNKKPGTVAGFRSSVLHTQE